MNEIKIIDTRKTGSRRIIAEGHTLKDACMNWYWATVDKTGNDGLFDTYVQLTGDHGSDEATDEELEQRYDRFWVWVDRLTGEQLFEFLRDGNYHDWEDWKEEDIEEEED